MATLIIVPIEIFNSYGNIRYVLNIPFLKCEKILSVEEKDMIVKRIRLMIGSITVITVVRPKMFVDVDKAKLKELEQCISAKSIMSIGNSGFSIDISAFLGEPIAKFQNCGDFSGIVRRPFISTDYHPDYPEVDVGKSLEKRNK